MLTWQAKLRTLLPAAVQSTLKPCNSQYNGVLRVKPVAVEQWCSETGDDSGPDADIQAFVNAADNSEERCGLPAGGVCMKRRLLCLL